MPTREPVKDYTGKILGWILTYPDKRKIYRDVYGKIVAKYDPATNTTRDFYGKRISKGDTGVSRIFNK